jgi:poly-beta-1,6-N-acetyl-D-glucosamine biosynthesis protein PgaD
MDKSRPGHHAERPERLPLIIERPDLAHPVRRVLGLVITILAWGLWVAMWIPLFAAIARHFGYDLPEIAFSSQISLDSFLALLRVTPAVLGAAVFVMLGSIVKEKIMARFAKPKVHWRPLGIDSLAADAALDPKELAQWQAARVLYVEHGPGGRVIGATTIRPPQ